MPPGSKARARLKLKAEGFRAILDEIAAPAVAQRRSSRMT
jgi:hypothetical protein